jgi:shikimate dehydrogenase
MRQYGLIGYPLTHSFSKQYFTDKFNREHIDARFEAYAIEKIALLPSIITQNQLQGFAVTIPYKKEVIAFLDDASAAVTAIGACNCVKITAEGLKGYNTDVLGFKRSFSELLQPQHTKALVLGTGGAAAAVEFVLQQMNISFCNVSRTKRPGHYTYDELNAAIMNEYKIIINTTPVGTYPGVKDCPAIPYECITETHYLYDLIYNPAETTFLTKGKANNAIVKNGYEMLILQAEENWRIWNE